MNRLRELRQEKKLSLAKMSKEVNISASLLGYYEREEREPKIETWEKLAKFFNVSPAYLMGISNEKESSKETLGKFKALLEIESSIKATEDLIKKAEKSYSSLDSISDSLWITAQYLDKPNDETANLTTDTINRLIYLTNKMLGNKDKEHLDDLQKIIKSIGDIYMRSTSKETLYSKETAIGKHLENLNTVTDILNSWYMTEIDQIKYNSKQSHGFE